MVLSKADYSVVSLENYLAAQMVAKLDALKVAQLVGYLEHN